MTSDFAPETTSSVNLGQSPDFELGAMRVMPARRQVQLGQDSRTLEPRVMQVLVALAQARPAVVSRDQLALACWGGLNTGDDAINRCIVSLRRLAREFNPQPFIIETVARVGYSLRETPGTGEDERVRSARWVLRGRLVVLLAIAASVIIVLLLWHPWRATAVSVAVAPSTASGDSQDLARDLTAKLGMLSDVSKGTRLLEGGRESNADLLFQVDASAQGQNIASNLMLLNNRHEILWSKELRQSQANLPDLKQQLAFTAAKVLECGEEAMDDGAQLSRQTLKLYLNGCAAFADTYEDNLDVLKKAFGGVTRDAPAFQPAWRRLLLVETQAVDLNEDPSARAPLEQAIASARRINPAMPEIYLAEAELLPQRQMSERMKLVEDAVRLDPDSAPIAQTHSTYLVSVGRMQDAVRESRRAVRLDPLSPASRESAVITLALAGRLNDAKEELKQAERLWPGAGSLRNARYLLDLRFGDPREAIRLREEGLWMPSGAPFQGSFLEARANPTPANIERALRDARALFSKSPSWIAHVAQAFGAFSHEEELYSILLSWHHWDAVDAVVDVLFRPQLHKFRSDPRFIRVAQRFGVLDYWRSSGNWPDFCFEPDLPYDCKREAAALARH